MTIPGVRMRALATFLLAVSVASAAVAGPYDGAVRTLEMAITPVRDGSHQALLISLRQLRDPTLRHLFERLLEHEQWQIQVHAVLGLAQLAEPRGIDPAMIGRVSPRAQEAVIATAIDAELLDPASIRELLARGQLKSLPRALLWAELHAAGEPVDPEALGALAVHDDDRVAGLASCLLAATGDRSAFSTFRQRLDAAGGRDRDALALWLIEVIRAYRVTPLMDWVRSLLDDPDVDPSLSAAGIITALELEPETGLAVWQRHLGSDPSKPKRVRYGVMLLAAKPPVPASAYDAFQTEDELVRRMAAAGRALSSGAPAAQALNDLIDLGHDMTAEWALEKAGSLEPAQRDAVYMHVIDTVDTDQPGRGARASRGVRATARLYDEAPDLVRERIAAAEDDGITQQTLLMGLLEAESRDASKEAAGIRRIGAGVADSLALLLVAKGDGPLSDADRTHLGLIASGGVPLSPGLKTQAAWLYLRHTASIERGLNDLLDDASPGS